MNWLTWIISQDWTAFIALVILLACCFIAAHGIRRYHDVPSIPRAYNGPIDPDLSEWWLPAEDFFRGRLERDERFARAVNRTVYGRRESDQ